MTTNVTHNHASMADGTDSRQPSRQPSPPPDMSNAEYLVWREFIQKRCGHFISENRIRFLRQRLWERMRLRNIKNYNDFYNFVAFNPAGNHEWTALQQLLLNNETSFFRHQPSFDALAELVLPRLRNIKQQHDIKAITMWSAGCSTGQEAYSLAMAFNETRLALPRPLQEGGWGQVLLKVVGSDICLKILEKARLGHYKPHELRQLPDYYRARYMDVVKKGGKIIYRIKKHLRDHVEFGYLHLLEPQSYWITGQDIIFCQNVLIYFQEEKRIEIVNRLCQRLNPGGYLFLGPAEVVGLKLPGIKLVHFKDVLIYQRIN